MPSKCVCAGVHVSPFCLHMCARALAHTRRRLCKRLCRDQRRGHPPAYLISEGPRRQGLLPDRWTFFFFFSECSKYWSRSLCLTWRCVSSCVKRTEEPVQVLSIFSLFFRHYLTFFNKRPSFYAVYRHFFNNRYDLISFFLFQSAHFTLNFKYLNRIYSLKKNHAAPLKSQ